MSGMQSPKSRGSGSAKPIASNIVVTTFPLCLQSLGPGDNFDPLTSNVLPALIQKFQIDVLISIVAVDAKHHGFGQIVNMQKLSHGSTGAPHDDLMLRLLLALFCVAGYEVSTRNLAETTDTLAKLYLIPHNLMECRVSWMGTGNCVADGIESTYQWYLEHKMASATLAA